MIKGYSKWIADINNKNVSVTFNKCILIVGIKNNISVKFDNFFKTYIKSVKQKMKITPNGI